MENQGPATEWNSDQQLESFSTLNIKHARKESIDTSIDVTGASQGRIQDLSLEGAKPT